MKKVLVLLLLLATPAYSQSDSIFETEYDVVLTIGANQYRSQGVARVENNDVVSIEFQEHKVELKVSLYDVDKYMVETSILESVDGVWIKLESDESHGFGAGIGSFSSFSWNGDGIRLNIAFSALLAGN